MKRPIKGEAVKDLTIIRFPCYGFPKIDGFRCVLGDYPMTSALSRFPNESFHNVLSGLVPRNELLDSEVVVGFRRGRGVLSRTSSGLTTRTGNPDFTLWVFDWFHEVLPFHERLDRARQLVKDIGHPSIRFLKPKLLRDYGELVEFLDWCLAKKFEGVITRSVDGIYKQGKSTLREQHMTKIKPFETAEGRIKGWFEEEENTNEAVREKTGKLKRSSAKSGKRGKGRLGGFILEDVKTGKPVRVGGGFTKAQRIGLWKRIQANPKEFLNELVTYKKQKVGQKDKPRHPNFVDFVSLRPRWDFTD